MTIHLVISFGSNGPDIWDAGVAIVSAIIGAAAGAIPAFILAKRSSKEVLERDRLARTDHERSVGMRAHVKLGTIVNSMLTLRRQLNEALANPPVPNAELWQAIEPIVGFAGEEKITFDAEEAALFLAARKSDYAEALLLIARRHAVQAEVIREYNVRRDQLRRDMPAPSSIDGALASTILDHDQMMRVRPQMVSLNTLLSQLIEYLADDIVLAIALARDFGPILRPYFKDDRYPSFVVPDDMDAIMTVRRYGGTDGPVASDERAD